MVLVMLTLALVVAATMAVAAVQQRLTASRQAVREGEAREGALLRELAAAKRHAAQVEAEQQFLSRTLPTRCTRAAARARSQCCC